MPIEILMPALSPTMTEGTLAKWLKKEGDRVSSGDVIAEIETDKATMEVEAADEGTLGKIVVPAGTSNVKVNEVIALLLGEGESAATLDKAAKPQAKEAAKPAAEAPRGNGHAEPQAASAAQPQQSAAAKPSPAAAPSLAAAQVPPPRPSGARLFASPLARRLARQAGLDLAGLTGSGPHGRIVKNDIDAAVAGGGARQAAAAPAAARPAAPPSLPAGDLVHGMDYELVPHSTMRKVIARRLTEAKRDVPHFYVTMDCHLDPLMKLRQELNARGEKEGFKLSVNDFVIKAAALALKRKPDVNAAWSEEGMLRFKTVDISVAVALPAGLITPIVRNADHKGLAEISNEFKELVARAKDNKLKPEEFQGGGFSVSNLGMYGVKDFTAIINPPQAAIIAVGAGEQRPVVKDGALAIQTMMSVTMSCDHRVVDGALGAQWLGIFKSLIEDPLTMML
jgi:pyruvate dehydrogenase E2 component (dihydrolipoamide acetyltransferase)